MQAEGSNSHQGDGYEEESVYVLLELPESQHLPKPGTKLRLEGMDTAEPRLVWEEGQWALVGAYEESVGTQLLFWYNVHEGEHEVELHSHTVNRLRFRAASPPLPRGEELPQGSGDAAAAASGAEGEQQQQQQQQLGPDEGSAEGQGGSEAMQT